VTGPFTLAYPKNIFCTTEEEKPETLQHDGEPSRF
jgi:hypothetical protein